MKTARRWSFVNELALGPDSAPFLAENECEAGLSNYSEKLLLTGGEDELLAELQRDDVRGAEHSAEFLTFPTPCGAAGHGYPRVKGKRSSAAQLRAAPVRPLQSGSLLAVRPFEKLSLFVKFFTLCRISLYGSIPFITGHFEGVIL